MTAGETVAGSRAIMSRCLSRGRQTGDEAAWNALIDEFGGVVWAATRAHRLSGADAADVFQTTRMHVVEKLDRIEDPARLGGWLATTARHESLNVIRRSVRLIPCADDLPEQPSDAPLPDERLIREQERHRRAGCPRAARAAQPCTAADAR